MLSDILKALETVPWFKEMKSVPMRLAAIEARLAVLEAKGGPDDATTCPRCRTQMAFKGDKPAANSAMSPIRLRSYACETCDYRADLQWTAGKGFL